jgi:hypothetical protein
VCLLLRQAVAEQRRAAHRCNHVASTTLPASPSAAAQVSEGNIRTLARELLDYLDVCDAEFKPDLANKVCQLVQRYAPDKRWYIDSLLQVSTRGGTLGVRLFV